MERSTVEETRSLHFLFGARACRQQTGALREHELTSTSGGHTQCIHICATSVAGTVAEGGSGCPATEHSSQRVPTDRSPWRWLASLCQVCLLSQVLGEISCLRAVSPIQKNHGTQAREQEGHSL